MSDPILREVVDLGARRPHTTVKNRLPPGDGGGTSDEMEARVASLEAKFERVDAKLDDILRRFDTTNGKIDAYKAEAAALGAKVDARPTTAGIIGIVATLVLFGVVSALAPIAASWLNQSIAESKARVQVLTTAPPAASSAP